MQRAPVIQAAFNLPRSADYRRDFHETAGCCQQVGSGFLMDSHHPASIRSLSEPKMGSLQVGVRIGRRRCHLSHEISEESLVTVAVAANAVLSES